MKGAGMKATHYSAQFGVLSGLLLLLAFITGVSAAEPGERYSLWIDLCEGEPVAYEKMLEDLAGVRVVYLGERHSVERHHETQARIVTDLGKKAPLVLALEQMEAVHQPTLDKYARGEITFEELAAQTQWAKRWRGYEGYKPVLEAARGHKAPILALNARSETIRQIARSGGVEKLAPETRKELPADMQLNDPVYAKLLGMQMMVHAAATPERLRPMVEAQIARDEQMASVLAALLQSPQGKGRTAVVICGAGHVEYGLGTPARVRRRLSEGKDRIVILSESGDVELSAADRAAARPITITHEQLREINRPIADYLYATSPKGRAGEGKGDDAN